MTYLNPEQRHSSSNKKLWIILGSVIGVLIIVMGGCVACGALIGLSTLSDQRGNSSNSRSQRRGSGEDEESGASSSGKDGALTSTTWNGTLNCDDGDNLPVVFKFSAAGNPIYEYQTSNGLRQVELTAPGQTFRFVPPGGGVTNIVLDSITVTSDRMSHTMSISNERAGGGTMIQGRSSIHTEAVVSGSNLEVEATIRSSSAVSQPGYVIPDESGTVCRGNLSKQ